MRTNLAEQEQTHRVRSVLLEQLLRVQRARVCRRSSEPPGETQAHALALAQAQPLQALHFRLSLLSRFKEESDPLAATLQHHYHTREALPSSSSNDQQTAFGACSRSDSGQAAHLLQRPRRLQCSARPPP